MRDLTILSLNTLSTLGNTNVKTNDEYKEYAQVYVGNLAIDVSEEQIQELFPTAKEIRYVRGHLVSSPRWRIRFG